MMVMIMMTMAMMTMMMMMIVMIMIRWDEIGCSSGWGALG